MTWDDGSAYLQELAPGVYAYVQPAGGWMVNNCGLITDSSGDAVLVDTTSTEKRNRALLAEVAGVAARDPKIAVNKRCGHRRSRSLACTIARSPGGIWLFD